MKKALTMSVTVLIIGIFAIAGIMSVFLFTSQQQVAVTEDLGEDIGVAIATAPRQFSGYDVNPIAL